MKYQLLLTAGVLALSSFEPLPAQVKNEGLANDIIAARQKNAALMKQYSWNCRTEILEKGEVKDTRIEQVTFGPDGQPQHTQLSDQSNPLPGGFIRKRIAENKRKDMEKFLQGLRALLHQYTLPTAGKVIDFISKTPIPAPGPGGILQLSGTSVVVPGDTISISINAPTKHTQRMSIMTFYQADEVTVTTTFKSLANGLNYPAYTQIDIPDKNLRVLIQNYDYINQNN